MSMLGRNAEDEVRATADHKTNLCPAFRVERSAGAAARCATWNLIQWAAAPEYPMTTPVRYNLAFPSSVELLSCGDAFSPGDEVVVGGLVYQFDDSSAPGPGIIVGNGGRWLQQMGGVFIENAPSAGLVLTGTAAQKAKWLPSPASPPLALSYKTSHVFTYPAGNWSVDPTMSVTLAASGPLGKVRISGVVCGWGTGNFFSTLSLMVDSVDEQALTNVRARTTDAPNPLRFDWVYDVGDTLPHVYDLRVYAGFYTNLVADLGSNPGCQWIIVQDLGE